MKGVTVKLTKAQITALHNARCDIYHLGERLNGVVDPTILKPLSKMFDALKPVLDPAYKIEEAQRDELQAVIDKLYPDAPGVYSIDEHPTTKIKGIPSNANVRFIYERYNNERASRLYKNPTYGDAFQAFCSLIEPDSNHIFFEGVGSPLKVREDRRRDVVIVELYSGS